MNQRELKKKFKDIQAQQDIHNFEENLTRARSISIGTTGGGVTEISLRGSGTQTLWMILQPVEVTELIHQLAGNIGCHIKIQPREDFASWRSWKVTEQEKLHWNGHPPHPNDLAFHNDVGALLPPPDQQPGLTNLSQTTNVPITGITNQTKEENEPLAITKTINKRKSKRTTTPP